MGCGQSSDTKDQKISENRPQNPPVASSVQQEPIQLAQPEIQYKILMMGINSSDYPPPAYQDVFIDEEFPGDASMPEDIVDGQGFWKNLKDSSGDGFFNFITDQPTLISNGGYSSNQMLVALEALMSKPSICNRIFIDIDPSQLNYFRVLLFDSQGQPCQSIVDHFIACDSDNQSFYVRCTNSVLPIFLEKAYAKFKQGYNLGEDVPSIIQTFTGCPFDLHVKENFADDNSLREKIQESLDQGYFVFVKTDGDDSLGFNQETFQVIATNESYISIRRVSAQTQYKGRFTEQNVDPYSRIEYFLEKPYDIVIGIDELYSLTQSVQVCLVTEKTKIYTLLPASGSNLINETFQITSQTDVRIEVRSSRLVHYFLAEWDYNSQSPTSILISKYTFKSDASNISLICGYYIFIARESLTEEDLNGELINFSASICETKQVLQPLYFYISDQQKERIIDHILQIDLRSNSQLTYPLEQENSFQQYIGECGGYLCIFIKNNTETIILDGQLSFENELYQLESDCEVNQDGYIYFQVHAYGNFFVRYSLKSQQSPGQWSDTQISTYYMSKDTQETDEKIWSEFENLAEQEIREYGEGQQVIVKKSQRQDGYYIYYLNQGQQIYEELLEFSNMNKVALSTLYSGYVDENHFRVTLEPNQKFALVLSYQDCKPKDFPNVSFEMTVVQGGPVVQNQVE